MKPKMTFEEGVRISWERERKRGNPWRILRLAFFTVYYGALHLAYRLIVKMAGGED